MGSEDINFRGVLQAMFLILREEAGSADLVKELDACDKYADEKRFAKCLAVISDKVPAAIADCPDAAALMVKYGGLGWI